MNATTPTLPKHTFHTSRNGRLNIHLVDHHARRGALPRFEVYAMYKGTHDIAPRTRRFNTLDEARAYANQLWAGR